mmetsp:Transcript_89481/g.286759  ORF Transcript_89481/g.286759 Transcript_89481/m.286759 type:complete len:355 (-) Transcript_89481:36-1100(-)
MHYDLFHRAGCRTSDNAPLRCMLKFQFIRTTEPVPIESNSIATSGMEKSMLGPAPKEVEPILEDIRAWLQGRWLRERGSTKACSGLPGRRGIVEDVKFGPEAGEVERLAAAYRLGVQGPSALPALMKMLSRSEAEARAAVYGLMAVGPEAAASLMPLLTDPSPRMRSLSAFALGESARPSGEVLDRFAAALRAESAPEVECTLLQALSCFASRARALEDRDLCRRCIDLVLPACLPALRMYSLRGENACLVVLMAGGLLGDIGSEAVRALSDVAQYSDDRYMHGFAVEALRRHFASRAQRNEEQGVVASRVCEQDEMRMAMVDALPEVECKPRLGEASGCVLSGCTVDFTPMTG